MKCCRCGNSEFNDDGDVEQYRVHEIVKTLCDDCYLDWLRYSRGLSHTRSLEVKHELYDINIKMRVKRDYESDYNTILDLLELHEKHFVKFIEDGVL